MLLTQRNVGEETDRDTNHNALKIYVILLFHSRSNSHRVKTANYWFLLVPSTTGRGTSIEINHPSLFTDDHRSDHRPGLEG